MARVSLLLLDDPVVSPHLQLLRQVCEPLSTSKPHVTVRYFERLRIPEEYRRAKVSHIDLIEPGMFKPRKNGSSSSNSGEARAVFIRCKSDDLTPLEHKPHFPDSAFHLTIYDGASKIFARRVLQELERFRWGFRVPLPVHTGLTVTELKKPNVQTTVTEPRYEPNLEELFRHITSRELSRAELVALSDDARLRLCRAILKSLSRATRHFERVLPDTPATSKVPQGGTAPEFSDVHLTPPELARDIAAYAISQIEDHEEPIDFGDPAVGTGAFFAALLQLVPRPRLKSAIGVDINPEQVAAARWRWADKGMEVFNADYLHLDELPARTLVLANPPYLRHQLIPQKYKRRLLERASVRTDIRISARSGLYVYFLLLGHDWMRPSAVAGWLIPSEFMRSVYGSAVRQYLTDKVEFLRVHVYRQDIPQFENVEVSPAVIVFRNRKPRPGHTVLMTAGPDLSNPETEHTVSLDDLRSSNFWTMPPQKQSVEGPHLRIGDLFTVNRGIATGANEFFIMTRERAKALGVPKSAAKPLLPKERALASDVVESDPDGYPKLVPQLSVIDCSLSEETIRAKYPRFMEYLKTAQREGILERTLIKRRHPWYKQEHREPPPFLCTYMGRGSERKPPLRFIWNKSRAIATNTYLLLYPRPAVAQILSRHPAAASQLFSALQQAAANGLREHARVHAGGLLKIEPRELCNVRLSFPAHTWLEAIERQLGLFR